MGAGDGVLYVSWLATYSLLFLISSTLVALIGGDIFGRVSGFEVFLLYFVFQLSVFCLAMLVASVFDKAQTAAMAGSILFLILAFPFYKVDRTSLGQQTVACLSAPICFIEAVSHPTLSSTRASHPLHLCSPYQLTAGLCGLCHWQRLSLCLCR